MRLEKRLFERFLKGVKEWLPSYYDSIVDTATIDDVGYKMGVDKEPAYIFDFPLFLFLFHGSDLGDIYTLSAFRPEQNF